MKTEITEYDFILNNFNLKNKTILDVGCGDCVNTQKLLQKKPKKLTGIDTKQPPRKKKFFTLGSCYSLPFSDCFFDLVMCIRVLPYVDIDKTISEISRVTKKKGTIIISSQGVGYYLSEIIKQHKLLSLGCIINGLLNNLFNFKIRKIDAFQIKSVLEKNLAKHNIRVIDEVVLLKYGLFKTIFLLRCKKMV